MDDQRISFTLKSVSKQRADETVPCPSWACLHCSPQTMPRISLGLEEQVPSQCRWQYKISVTCGKKVVDSKAEASVPSLPALRTRWSRQAALWEAMN